MGVFKVCSYINIINEKAVKLYFEKRKTRKDVNLFHPLL